MIAVAAGFAASFGWAISALCAARASALIGPWSTVAWMMIVGALATLPVCLVAGLPGDVPAASLGLLVFAGLANVVGLGIQYLAYRSGKVAIVAAVVSTEGVIAGLLALLGGETLALVESLGLLAVAGGVFVAGFARDPDPAPAANPVRAILLALVVAFLFGGAVYSIGKVGSEQSVILALIPARLAGVCLLALPLLMRRRLRLTRQAAPFVVAGGLAEVAITAVIAIGSGDSLTVTSVLASQWAALTAVGAFVFLGQRLGRVQIAGIAVIAVGVTTVSLGRIA